MLGVNIGIPVPRDPFSFGGLKESKFGSGDVSAKYSHQFYTNTVKVTTKWESRRQSGLDELKSSCNRYYDFENHIMQILCKSKNSSKRVINLYNYSLRRTFTMAKNSKIKQLTQEPMESEDINSAG